MHCRLTFTHGKTVRPLPILSAICHRLSNQLVAWETAETNVRSTEVQMAKRMYLAIVEQSWQRTSDP